MSEDQIELRVERTMDRIDAKFLSGKLTQDGYDMAVAAIHDWADKAFRVWQIRMLRA